jgi:hypothetical protein
MSASKHLEHADAARHAEGKPIAYFPWIRALEQARKFFTATPIHNPLIQFQFPFLFVLDR